ncbi:hypothetical protein HPB49_012850 [Dermacentor silvarum]|uniref:Uncharacterized protein n=1 Tax=Dermacentor silvarum TaxID=543639 RepID=A0ACB8C3Q6_DERSI|nr:hypothetical protein HPB49_012850 [Dermacentor silvarum]
MDRAERYLKIATLTIMDKRYEVSTHVADPKNSCRAIIKLPASLVKGNVLVNLRDCNPTIKILAARRMGFTDSILVTFESSRSPSTLITSTQTCAADHIGKKWRRVISAGSLAIVKMSSLM